MRQTFQALAAAGGLVLVMCAPVRAGEQYVDGSGYAVSGYDVVAYFDMQQSPIGQAQPLPVLGEADITADYNGATFAFASEEHRDRFIANPAKYAPQFDGHCAFGVAKGNKMPGDPTLWRIVDGKLYLNLQQSVTTMWEADVSGNLTEASTSWDKLASVPASKQSVPELGSSSPAR
jgi:YHS domain-containing protein